MKIEINWQFPFFHRIKRQRHLSPKQVAATMTDLLPMIAVMAVTARAVQAVKNKKRNKK